MTARQPGPVLLPAPPPGDSPEPEPSGRLGDLVQRYGVLLLALACGVGAWTLLGGATAGGRGVARGYLDDVSLTVSSLRPGRVAEVTVGLGATVKRGDVVARLDVTELEAQKRKLLAQRDVAVAEVQAAAEVQDAAVLRTEVWRLRTVADSKRDQAELEALEREVKRLEVLYERQLVKASEIEPLRRQRDALLARVSTFASAASEGQAGLGYQSEARGRHAASVKQRLLPLRQQRVVAEAAIAELEVQIAAALLRAPADGVVATIDRRPGETVAAGDPVVTIAAGRPGIVIAFLPERRADVGVGREVTVSGFTLMERGRPGRIVEMAPDVAEVPLRFRNAPTVPMYARRVIVQLSAQTGHPWLPGQEVRVRF